MTLSTVWYGSTRSGDVPTDQLFTGQRYDDTGLYYYGARYYDPEIGRFISADILIPNPADPQSFNRYSYCLNNPLKYVDPSGHSGEKPWKPDFTKDDPWEGVPEDYTGYVPAGHERVPSEPDMPVNDDLLSNTKGIGVNVSGGIGHGGSISGLIVWDGEGNIGLLITTGQGEYAGCGVNGGWQTQLTNADTIFDLEGDSLSGGGSATVGVTSLETWGVVNIGQTTGVEYIEGPDYSGVNLQRGPGGSIVPVEFHTFDESSELVWSFNIKEVFISIKDYFTHFDWW